MFLVSSGEFSQFKLKSKEFQVLNDKALLIDATWAHMQITLLALYCEGC